MSGAGDDVSTSEGELGSSPPSGHRPTVSELMQNPGLLAAVQDGLSGLVGQQSGYIQSLPKCVKRRLKALKKLQAECCKLEGKFYEEVHELECKYAEKFKPLYDKRKSIANGNVEPNDEECDWPSDEEHEEEEEGGEDEEKKAKEEKEKTEVDQLSGEVKDKVKLDDTETLSEDTKGIPEFWLTTMKNVDMICEMIQEHDDPILKHLTDIKVIFVSPCSNVENSSYPLPTPMGFVLEFHFSANQYFTNTVLTKSYQMKCEPEEDDPFSFEGPEIVQTTGCKIDWKKGKNVTQKVVKKKQRHKGRGQTRFVNKTVKNDSFFNFFAPPEVTEEEMDEDTQSLLAADFEIGHFFRERLIPKAVLYFTGEANDDDFDEDEEDEDDDGMHGDGDEDDDDDPDYNPPPGENPQECKQQ